MGSCASCTSKSVRSNITLAIKMPPFYEPNEEINEEALKCIRQSWEEINNGNSSSFQKAKEAHPTLTPLVFFHDKFYTHLFHWLPSMKDKFKINITSKARIFSRLVGLIMCILEDHNNPQLLPCLEQLGVLMNGYNVEAHDYTVFAFALVDSIRHCVGDDFWSEQMKLSWFRLISKMMSMMLPMTMSGFKPESPEWLSKKKSYESRGLTTDIFTLVKRMAETARASLSALEERGGSRRFRWSMDFRPFTPSRIRSGDESYTSPAASRNTMPDMPNALNEALSGVKGSRRSISLSVGFRVNPDSSPEPTSPSPLRASARRSKENRMQVSSSSASKLGTVARTASIVNPRPPDHRSRRRLLFDANDPRARQLIVHDTSPAPSPPSAPPTPPRFGAKVPSPPRSSAPSLTEKSTKTEDSRSQKSTFTESSPQLSARSLVEKEFTISDGGRSPVSSSRRKKLPPLRNVMGPDGDTLRTSHEEPLKRSVSSHQLPQLDLSALRTSSSANSARELLSPATSGTSDSEDYHRRNSVVSVTSSMASTVSWSSGGSDSQPGTPQLPGAPGPPPRHNRCSSLENFQRDLTGSRRASFLHLGRKLSRVAPTHEQINS